MLNQKMKKASDYNPSKYTKNTKWETESMSMSTFYPNNPSLPKEDRKKIEPKQQSLWVSETIEKFSSENDKILPTTASNKLQNEKKLRDSLAFEHPLSEYIGGDKIPRTPPNDFQSTDSSKENMPESPKMKAFRRWSKEPMSIGFRLEPEVVSNRCDSSSVKDSLTWNIESECSPKIHMKGISVNTAPFAYYDVDDTNFTGTNLQHNMRGGIRPSTAGIIRPSPFYLDENLVGSSSIYIDALNEKHKKLCDTLSASQQQISSPVAENTNKLMTMKSPQKVNINHSLLYTGEPSLEAEEKSISPRQTIVTSSFSKTLNSINNTLENLFTTKKKKPDDGSNTSSTSDNRSSNKDSDDNKSHSISATHTADIASRRSKGKKKSQAKSNKNTKYKKTVSSSTTNASKSIVMLKKKSLTLQRQNRKGRFKKRVEAPLSTSKPSKTTRSIVVTGRHSSKVTQPKGKYHHRGGNHSKTSVSTFKSTTSRGIKRIKGIKKTNSNVNSNNCLKTSPATIGESESLQKTNQEKTTLATVSETPEIVSADDGSDDKATTIINLDTIGLELTEDNQHYFGVAVSSSKNPKDFKYLPPEAITDIPPAGIKTKRSEQLKQLFSCY